MGTLNDYSRWEEEIIQSARYNTCTWSIYIRNQKPWGGVQPSVFKRPSWWLWCPRQFENHCLNPQICGKAHVNTGHSLYPKFKASSSLNFCLKWSLTSVQQMLCHSVPGTLPVTAGQRGRIHWWTRKTGSILGGHITMEIVCICPREKVWNWHTPKMPAIEISV